MRLSWTSGHDVLESSPDLDKCFIARLTVEGAEAGDSRQYIVR